MVNNQCTLSGLLSDLKGQYETPYVTHIRFEECRIRIVSNSESVVRALARYYRAFAQESLCADLTVTVLEGEPPIFDDNAFTPCHRKDTKRGVKEAYLDLPDGRIVRKLRTGMMFLFGPHDHITIGECERNLPQVINFIDNRYTEWRLARGGDLLHAAGVARDHRGLAIAGVSGKGKSTLALHLVGRGMDFISNDRLILDASLPGLRMYGLAKQPRVNPGTLLNNPNLDPLLDEAQRSRLDRLSPEELWSLEEKCDVDVEECFGPGRHVLLARFSELVIVNWDHSDQPMRMNRIHLFERDDLIRIVAKPRGVFRLGPVQTEVTQDDVANLRNRLGACPTYEITGGIDFPAAVEACVALLDHNAEACAVC